MTEYPIALPRRVEILLRFLLAGNVINFEGRELVLVESHNQLTLASYAGVLTFEGGPPERKASSMIVAPFSLSRFLGMAKTFTHGDYVRMLNILKEKEQP